MLKSMTGYGRASRSGNGFCVTVEIRTLNHRFREIVIRGPREWLAVEDDLRRIVADAVYRGRVDVYITVVPEGEVGRRAVLDTRLVRTMKEAVDALAAELGLPESIGVGQLISLPGVVSVEEVSVDPEAGRTVAEEALREALAMLVSARSEEGCRLEEELTVRLREMERLIDEIRARAPEVPEEYRRRLEGRLREWKLDAALDEGRLMAEVALLADRVSIDEELVRLSSHLEQFEAAMKTGGPVGRRLDFLLQEMHRELNTIGAKAGDVEIAKRVVDAKTLLEQLREQVQNVE